MHQSSVQNCCITELRHWAMNFFTFCIFSSYFSSWCTHFHPSILQTPHFQQNPGYVDTNLLYVRF